MQVMLNIGGSETLVEMPDSIGVIEPDITFNDDFVVVRLGNYVKISGLTTVQTEAIRDITDYMEGVKAITFPLDFYKLIDYQATALDNNSGSCVEHAHLGQVTKTGMNVYATTFGSESKEIKVKWYVEGVI